MDNLTHDEIELGLTSEFAAAAERERERLEAERAKADQRLTEAQTALNVATGRHQALERLLADDPQERGHAAEFVEGAERERERLDGLLAAAEQEVAEAQAKRDRLASQIRELDRLLSDEPEDLDTTDAPRADANAVLDVLVDRGKPMHYRDIYTVLADAGFKVGGADPASTLLTRFYDDTRLERVARGTYQIREDDDWRDPEHNVLAFVEWILQQAGEPLDHCELARRMRVDADWIHQDVDWSSEEFWSRQVVRSLDDLDLERIVALQMADGIKRRHVRPRFRRVGPVGYGTYVYDRLAPLRIDRGQSGHQHA